jgi:DNA polymerase-4
MGGSLYDHANGIDDSPVSSASEKRRIKSVGKGLTFRTDIQGEDQIRVGVTALADSVAGRLRKYGLKCQGVKVDIKDPHFKLISRQKQLSRPSDITEEIVGCAMSIINDSWKLDRPIRLITVTGINLTAEDFPEQLSFLGMPEISAAKPTQARTQAESIDRTVDEIRMRYGNNAIFYGNILNNNIGIELDVMSEEESLQV